ncbi:MAG: acetylxylan esterase [Myxococcota bacterium]
MDNRVAITTLVVWFFSACGGVQAPSQPAGQGDVTTATQPPSGDAVGGDADGPLEGDVVAEVDAVEPQPDVTSPHDDADAAVSSDVVEQPDIVSPSDVIEPTDVSGSEADISDTEGDAGEPLPDGDASSQADCEVENGGCAQLCTEGDDGIECACEEGYELASDGFECLNIDDCLGGPCANDGECTDLVAGFSCECAPGYTGETCAEDIDECGDAPCLNGGTCVDGVASYTCECMAGYSGEVCETDIDECGDAPCLNGGTCVDGVASYTCECAAGYTGETCAEDIDECADSPCQNGGTCVDGVASFSCECAPGYSGETCGVEIEDCAGGPCQNGATCVEGVATFTCECAPGFAGDLCETDIDDCVDASCANGGTCVDGVASYTCECAPGYSGEACETDIDECADAPCMNGGTCTEGLASFSCECAPGYSGEACETDIDECADAPCMHGGTCIDGVASFACACLNGWEGALCGLCPAGSFDDGEGLCALCPDGFTSPESATGCVVATTGGYTHVRDYGYTYWPTNHWFQQPAYNAVRHVQTGYYGLAFDVKAGNLDTLGIFDEERSAEDALHQDKGLVDGLAEASVTYGVSHGGADRVAAAFLGVDGDAQNPSRLTDMGRFMQRFEIPQVTYEDTSDLSGSVEVAAMPRHFVLTHRATSVAGGGPMVVSVELSGEAVVQFGETEWLDGARAVSVTDGAGRGWSFILAELSGATPNISRSADGTLLFEMSYDVASAGQERTLSLIAVPSNAGGDAQRDLWLHPQEDVQVQYAQMQRDGSGGDVLEDASWDPVRGLFVVALHNLGEVGGGWGKDWSDPSKHNWYNRHRLVIHNETEEPVSVPIAFDGGGNAAYYITGGIPLYRDTQGEPIGAPIQISKNWHDPPAWYHLYSALQLEPGSHEFEHTFAHSKWGEAYAAQHSQLSLIGWGKNQQWDQSSLGAFGESITYDPDMTLNRAMVDDVRPFLVKTKNKWDWTGNVGGATFLVYKSDTTDNRPEHQLGRLRTHYNYTGPNLTDVVYAGVTRDQKISARIATQLGRTDDLVRAYYHLEYTFHETVPYDRLALFQMAADRYGDNGFSRYAYGNASQVFADKPVPNHGTTGYASNADRGIALEGDAPWVMLYDSDHSSGELPEHLANIAFVVRDYEATLGDTVITTPHINIMRTSNNGWSQMSFELGVPFDPANASIPAGSVIRATVEYLVPPADKDAYYGESDYLTELSASSYQSTDMAMMLAADNQLEVTPFVGTLVRTHPLEFEASQGATAVRFTLTGGLGYTPLTIRGLARPDGWRLERQVDAAWEQVDQAVEGSDYWQAFDNAATRDFDLVFNVHNRGTHHYRLVRGDTPCVGVLEGDAIVCDDVDECLTDNGGCAHGCENLEGTFVCSCDAGYALAVDGLSCDDVDECMSDNAGCAQDCINVDGGVSCGCHDGFTLNADGVSCDDIDECADAALNDCAPDEPCANTSGAFVCGCVPPACQPEGCTNPDAPNYEPKALLDDGSCFECAEGHAHGSRVTQCDWDCEEAWGACLVVPGDGACTFYFCEVETSCMDLSPTEDAFAEERALVQALGALTDAPLMRVDDTTDELAELASGQSKAIYFDALDYEGAPTRVYARIALPVGASADAPVPGVVLVHGGGGTAFSMWASEWRARGYAAISIAVEGQNDDAATQDDIDAGMAVGYWKRHQMAGPARDGAYGDVDVPLTDQWMYHAVADTVLANSLLRALPEVDADQVGVMGISWGAVITATTMGIDDRFAFAVPVYGAGHKYDIPNYFGDALEGNPMYRELWDPMQWIESAEMPALWLSWPEENNFSHDSQAATYHQASGPRMVSLVPGMGHGHSPAWDRPESYAFAESVVDFGAPWAQQVSVGLDAGVAEAVFTSTKALGAASLFYATESGWTGEMAWSEVGASLSQGPEGAWTITAELPIDATGWFMHATTAEEALVLSSDYIEQLALDVSPQAGVSIGHPLFMDQSLGTALVSFEAPSYVEIIDVTVHGETHPGAFCSPQLLPWVLKSPAPAVSTLEVLFDNTVAGLSEGQTAEGTMALVFARLDGTTGHVEVPLYAVAQSSFEVVYDVSADWSTQTVYSSDNVTIEGGAVVDVDVDQSVADLTVSDGTLQMDEGVTLASSGAIAVAAGGEVALNTGVLGANGANLSVDGTIVVDGGTLTRDMSGVSRTISGGGLIDVRSGSMAFTGGVPTNILSLKTDMRISGGTVALSGQLYVGDGTQTVFEIVGDAPTVSMVRLNVHNGCDGIFRFTLNATGVSKINVPGWMNLGNATIEVDGADYEGGAGSFVLIDSNNLTELINPANVVITGFEEQGLTASVVQDQANGKDWVQLVIEAL